MYYQRRTNTRRLRSNTYLIYNSVLLDHCSAVYAKAVTGGCIVFDDRTAAIGADRLVGHKHMSDAE